ncbi:MAG: hypothetical protein U5K29_09840 [Acidimicrobiales bacterium]|nr:hypothetical protein [Acidimicrobiales bacterium]
MSPASANDQRAIVWVPADEGTEVAIRDLVGVVPSSPAHLRLVGG